ncbi:MAG: GGDEF domain-containing protein [Lachnospiraceae bacterium]|nr:GGDEF domain-containing protein [Lachnospiraceae bacterium]
MFQKKGKDNFIKPFAFFGAIVILICLVTCVYHVFDVRNNLEDEVNAQLRVQLEVASEVLSDEVEKTGGIVAVLAGEMGERYTVGTVNEYEIYHLLNKYKSIDDFQELCFIANDNVMYFGDGWNKDISGIVRDEMHQITEGEVYISDEFFISNKEHQMLFIEPVICEDECIGYVLGVKSCKNMLDSDSFSYLREIGDVMVVDKEGVILDCHFTNLVDQTDYYATIYDCMDRYWSINEESRTQLKEMIVAEEIREATVECVGWNQMLTEETRYFYSFATIEAFPNLVVVSMYDESIYGTSENSIVVGSIIACAILVVSMAFLVFVAYRHNFSADQLITQLAYDDEVTGGKNLNYFKEYVADVLYKYQGMPFLIHRMDVSNFRYINEAYGHVRADELLKIIIEEATALFYSKELCVRMNADQFVMLTKNTQDLEERFFVFTDKVNARALDIGIRYPIKFKRGVYQVKNKEYDINLLIDKANAARKTLTGDEKECTAYYSEKLVVDMRKVDKIESEMETALFNGEFKMFIQPKWDIVKDHLYGGEALVRWMKEDGTMVYPNDFVPVFERNGFVEQLDFFMLESACQLIRNNINEGREIYPISVNQSRVLLHNPTYIGRVSEMLQRYDIPKGYIELEITETVLFTERAKMLTILKELKEREVLLSMDDFGSGYSSLNMLKDFPFDVLKIDREFFSESIASESSTWILRKIIEMANGLGIRVICEGVETKEQVEMLQKIGCRYVQGYYYSKPIPAEKFVETYCKESA